MEWFWKNYETRRVPSMCECTFNGYSQDNKANRTKIYHYIFSPDKDIKLNCFQVFLNAINKFPKMLINQSK